MKCVYKVDGSCIQPYFSTHFALKSNDGAIIQDNVKNNYGEIIVGKRYTLQGEKCDGFDMPIKTYEAICKLPVINGVQVNAVIMKEIDSDNTSTIFSLTKNDCNSLNIEFQPRLQIFPAQLNWRLTESSDADDKVEFNVDDLSTYPVNYQDKKIHSVIIKLSGYRGNKNTIITPDGNSIKLVDFMRNFSVYAKENIGQIDDMESRYIAAGDKLSVKLIDRPFDNREMVNDILDTRGFIFCEVMFDGATNIGINPKYFKHHKASDVIDIRVVFFIYKNTYKQPNRRTQKEDYYGSLMDTFNGPLWQYNSKIVYDDDALFEKLKHYLTSSDMSW